jgi:hypothetical protein
VQVGFRGSSTRPSENSTGSTGSITNLRSELPSTGSITIFIFKLRTREKFQDKNGVHGPRRIFMRNCPSPAITNLKTELVRSGLPPISFSNYAPVRNFRTKMGGPGGRATGPGPWTSPNFRPKRGPWTGNSNSYVWVTQKKETQLPFYGQNGVQKGLGNSRIKLRYGSMDLMARGSAPAPARRPNRPYSPIQIY